MELPKDAILYGLTPHAHHRGASASVSLRYPDGHEEMLLALPRYDFNWQLSYILAEPRKIPAGSRIDATAWYDNSANNKFNPDPTKDVRWGDQSWEEMMIGWFNYTVPAGASPRSALTASSRDE